MRETYGRLTLDIIKSAKKGNKESILFIFNKYTPLIDKYCRSYHLKNYDSDDLTQEGFLAVIKAINMYDISKGVTSFDSYVITTIKNCYGCLARVNIKYNEESSLNLTINDGVDFLDLLEDNSYSTNIENRYIKNEQIKNIILALNKLNQEDKLFVKNLYYNCKGSLLKYCKTNNIVYYAAKKQLNRILYTIRTYIY